MGEITLKEVIDAITEYAEKDETILRSIPFTIAIDDDAIFIMCEDRTEIVIKLDDERNNQTTE